LYDERTKTPIQTALTDTFDEFVVEKILDMRGNPRGPKKLLEFKVRWAGYEPQDDTWEPWEYVKNNDQLQSYLFTHKDKRLQKWVNKDYIPPHMRQDNESSDEDSN
jgi:hypothetical protein